MTWHAQISSLIVTQHDLRYHEQIPQMIEFAKAGGVWTAAVLAEYAKSFHAGRTSPLIQISRFPDGKDFIHDGHHRIVTTWLSGRDMLFPEEYEVTEWTYDEYLEINPQAGWFTPYDPRIHCRKPDLADYKAMIRKLVEQPNFEEMVHGFKDLYCEPRRYHTIEEMAKHSLGMERDENGKAA